MQGVDLTKLGWIKVTTQLPNNGEEVLIAVKNKNKPDGIWLFDLAIFTKGVGFEERRSTWEDILFWSPLINPVENE